MLSKRKSPIAIVLALGLILVIVYFSLPGKFKSAKTPYPKGTQIENSYNLPAEFPQEILQEQLPIGRADVVKLPDGSQKISVEYYSEQPLTDLLLLYAGALADQDWQIQSNQVLKASGAIVAKKGNQTLIVTAAAYGERNKVTFQLEIPKILK